VGAGLLLASFRELLHVDPGFNTENVLTASTIAPTATYPEAADRRVLVRRTLEAARALPGVVQAGATSAIPLSGSTSDSVIFAEGYQMKPGESVISPRQVRVTPGYFEAMEIGLVRGRYFTDGDDENATRAIIVDEKLAERFWPDEDPLGRRMYQPQNIDDLFKVDENTVFYTVVGVVRNIRPDDLAGEGSPVGTYYFAFAQSPQSFFTIAARTAGAPESLIRPLQAELAAIDPELALFDVRTMEQRAELSLSSRRTAMTLAIGFGAVALFLAAIGVYGVLAYSVSQRKREIGIRVALGSTAAEVASLVVRQGLAVAGAGLLLGGVGAIGLQRVIATEIYGVGAADPAVLGAVVLLMGAVAATASLLPALRASRIDPLRALNE
jgi:predicted permease